MRIMNTRGFLALLLLIINSSAQTAWADYEAGRTAANSGDFSSALREWMPLATSGHADAQYSLGRMYARGDGVKRDFKEAQHWFALAAAQGHAKACLKLGTMYEYGDGMKKNLAEAAHWYSIASEKGEPEATNRLAALKKRGISIPSSAGTAASEPTPDATEAPTPTLEDNVNSAAPALSPTPLSSAASPPTSVSDPDMQELDRILDEKRKLHESE